MEQYPYTALIRELQFRNSGLSIHDFEQKELIDLLKKNYTPNYRAILEQIRSLQNER